MANLKVVVVVGKYFSLLKSLINAMQQLILDFFFIEFFTPIKKILDWLETGKRIQTCRRPEISDPIGHKMVTVEHVSIYFDGWP